MQKTKRSVGKEKKGCEKQRGGNRARQRQYRVSLAALFQTVQPESWQKLPNYLFPFTAYTFIFVFPACARSDHAAATNILEVRFWVAALHELVSILLFIQKFFNQLAVSPDRALFSVSFNG